MKNKISIGKYYRTGKDNRAKIFEEDVLIGYLIINCDDLLVTDVSNYIQGRLIKKIEWVKESNGETVNENDGFDSVGIDWRHSLVRLNELYLRVGSDESDEKLFENKEEKEESIKAVAHYRILNREHDYINDKQYKTKDMALKALLKYCKKYNLISV